MFSSIITEQLEEENQAKPGSLGKMAIKMIKLRVYILYAYIMQLHA